MTVVGTFQACRNVQLESVMRLKADVRRRLSFYEFTPSAVNHKLARWAACEVRHAPIADALSHSSETTLCAISGPAES
jgi:hypothetical protein